MNHIIAPSAYRHGVTEEDILHAFRRPVRIWPDIDDGLDMLVGPSRSAALLEIGIVVADDGTQIIVHAMQARTKFL